MFTSDIRILGNNLQFSLCLIDQPLHQKTSEGVEARTHILLTSAQDGGEWSASQAGRFIPWEGVPLHIE
jgi:hypothetical protein